jgi:low temperature requirement protein LtrA
VWVGIIANLSHTYSTLAFTDNGLSPGIAFLEFLLLFIPIWRVWDHLRSFSSNFYNDDVFQRQFICWILIVAIVYGINAPFAFSPDGGATSLTVLITTYLVAKASFLFAQATQAFFMPFLRRQFLIQVAATLVTSALWIPAIWVSYPSKIILLILANALEHPFDVLMASPLGDRLLTDGWKRNIHVGHYIERYEEFFIVILGEGVFRLIEGSPSGMGVNQTTGTVIIVLLFFLVIHWLYFNGDHSKRYIHALKRTWWRPMLWQM